MHISWLGNTCVKLQTKNLDEDVVILINPYRPEQGDFPKNLAANIALFSHGPNGTITLMQNPFVLDTLGECEVKGVMIYAYPHADGIIFKLNAEGLSIVHLGTTKTKIDTSLIDKLGNIDILLLPVGGKNVYLDPDKAAETVNELEPRIVIPIAYHCDTDKNVLPVENFVKELGIKPEITDKKIIIKKKDLPQDDRKLYILEKNY
ncbi:MAG: hypothetical protein A2538_02545 [Candidatus Magasanikbacteria bacterium RIFOXYD2_FULL_41_14]|uniref:Lactamase n=1 Tax=Candidatus Magasanikbacteria bacterium RIFOXYD2_FULL_41_14 TaxID=1798709 RepID=A0A1F6PC38_9BACT|nr:MAG: hypothetical protein A2538_02545 [Candidatus Magasanikbacteria bacterium RIFOXYD2_FULL_41_14]